jgi:hypothetical protein
MMNRVGTFFLGFLVGGAVVYTSLHYHIVRAHNGMHLIPKMSSTFSETYVDVRGFGFQDWTDHASLAAAISAAGKTEIMQGSITQPIHEAVDGFMDRVTRP